MLKRRPRGSTLGAWQTRGSDPRNSARQVAYGDEHSGEGQNCPHALGVVHGVFPRVFEDLEKFHSSSLVHQPVADVSNEHDDIYATKCQVNICVH